MSILYVYALQYQLRIIPFERAIAAYHRFTHALIYTQQHKK